MTHRLRVHFIHGLEGSPQGAKPRFLAEHFDTVAPAMDTSDLPGAIATQEAALAASAPDVLVGSSFGGAIAVDLLARGVWRGPTVLLAPAASTTTSSRWPTAARSLRRERLRWCASSRSSTTIG
jgi:predicted esterase YcpF (UPF0227 family)